MKKTPRHALWNPYSIYFRMVVPFFCSLTHILLPLRSPVLNAGPYICKQKIGAQKAAGTYGSHFLALRPDRGEFQKSCVVGSLLLNHLGPEKRQSESKAEAPQPANRKLSVRIRHPKTAYVPGLKELSLHAGTHQVLNSTTSKPGEGRKEGESASFSPAKQRDVCKTMSKISRHPLWECSGFWGIVERSRSPASPSNSP